MSDSRDLVDAIVLGSARGGRAGEPLIVTSIRELTDEDLATISSTSPSVALTPTIQQLRHNHHRLAQLLAGGTPAVEASLITGYSQSRISVLRGDPTFRELLAYYESQKELAFGDLMERMATLGLSFVDELQERLEREPTKFTNREVMEAIELLGLKPRQPSLGGVSAGQGGGGVSLNIQFVQPQTAQVVGVSIEAEAREVEFADIRSGGEE